jgi:hypothetical protein
MSEAKTDGFRGLLYNPTLENEVIILFSLLIRDLKDSFAIEEYSGSFPDCFALRNGKRIGIEFELRASNFNHENSDNLTKCSLLVCWKNDFRNTTKRDGIEFLNVKGHEIEIMSLDKIVAELQKIMPHKFIKNGDTPEVYRVGEEKFFEQLERTRPKRYDWVKGLYDQVKQSDYFKVDWGGGRRFSTMRFYVKKWDVSPIIIYGNGSIEIGYQGNKSIFPWWEIPEETKTELQRIFNNPKQKWYHVPLDTHKDLNNVNKAIEILAEHSKRFPDILWHTKG